MCVRPRRAVRARLHTPRRKEDEVGLCDFGELPRCVDGLQGGNPSHQRQHWQCIPMEVPSLSECQMQEAVPRRLTNPRAEVVDLSTGVEDVVPVVVFDANIYDEYAAEATSV